MLGIGSPPVDNRTGAASPSSRTFGWPRAMNRVHVTRSAIPKQGGEIEDRDTEGGPAGNAASAARPPTTEELALLHVASFRSESGEASGDMLEPTPLRRRLLWGLLPAFLLVVHPDPSCRLFALPAGLADRRLGHRSFQQRRACGQ